MKLSQFLGFALCTFSSKVASFSTATEAKPGYGCNKTLPSGVLPDTSVNLTIASTSGVTPRKYRIHLPPSYDNTKNVPLILSFHGRGKDGKFQEELSQFSNASYGFKGITVYPEGVSNVNGTQQYQGDPDSPSYINDVQFTLELLDHLQATYCIDTRRIYAAGKSNGGGFTGLLACDPEATKRIAAFAPVSGAFYLDPNGTLPKCKPSRIPIPIMEFHGFDDTTIPYAGGINTRGNANSTDIVSYVDTWAVRNGFTTAENTTTTLCKGKKKVTRYGWDNVTVHYNYTNLNHDWPSSFANGDTKNALTCADAEATSIILDWFKMWAL